MTKLPRFASVLLLLSACEAPSSEADDPSVVPSGATVDAAPVARMDADDATPSSGDGAPASEAPDVAEEPPQVCVLWETPLLASRPEDPPADCAALGTPDMYACAEAAVWGALQDRLDSRADVHATLTAVIAAADPETQANDLARMLAYRGQIALALILENDDPRFIAGVIPDLERAAGLAPDNGNLPIWKDTMDIAFASISGDAEALRVAAERAFGHVESGGGCAFVNTISLAGTTIGLPLATGYPQRTVELLRTYRCDGLNFCTENTWRAPFARPGLAYQLGEAYARVGDAEAARTHFADALTAPGGAAWPYAPMTQDTLDHLDEVLAEYAAVPPDRGVFRSVSGNSRFGCVMCHASSPPTELVPATRLVIVPDPGPMPPSEPPPPPPEEPLPGEPLTGEALDFLVGDWATWAVEGSIVTTPIGEQPSRIETFGLARVERDADGLRITENGCHVEGVPAPGFTLTINDAVPRSVAPLAAALNVHAGEGNAVDLARPRVSRAVGWAPDRDADEPLPADGADPRVEDSDGNGFPGISTTISGILGDIRLDVVQRQCGSWRGRLNREGPVPRFEVTQDTACSAQHTLAATNALFAADTPMRPADDPALHRVVFVRLDRPAACDEMLARRATLFAAP